MKAICHRKAAGGETYGVSHVRRDQHEGHLPQEGWGREKHMGLVMYAVISMKAICHRKAGGGRNIRG